MDQSLAQLAGMQPSKPSPYAPLGTKRFFTGLVTSRSPLIEPGTRAESRFYGGRPDALWDGSNVEVSANNTLIRRPGHTLFSTLPSAPKSIYTFRAPLQAIRQFADTATGPFQIANGSDPVSPLFTKSAGAGQTFFQGVGAQLFMSDGVDLLKWDGTHLWSWGIIPPSNAPTLQISAGGAPGTPSLSTTSAGSLTGQGTLYVRTSFITPFGETQASAEAFTAVANNTELVVAFPTSAPANATGWNVYIGSLAGAETKQNTTAIALAVNYTQATIITTTGAVPPGSLTGSYTITSYLGVSYAYCFYNSETGHVSTASPVSPYTGPQTGVNITITGNGSTDPQVDTIQLYRTTDGGASYFLLSESIVNPGSGTWTYVDSGTPTTV